MNKINKTYKNRYFEFTPGWSGFDITYHVAGYFDHRPMLQIYIIWGKLFIYLPWLHYNKVKIKQTISEERADKLNTLNDPKYKPKIKYKKELYDECEPPKHGIYYYDSNLVFCLGNKQKFIHMPWEWVWVRTSALTKYNTWIHDTKNDRKKFWNDKWKFSLLIEEYPFQYITKNNEIQNCIATIKVEEREWRWRGFKWLKYPRKINKSIEVNFSEEMGEKKGSWKGGVLGMSYKMLPNETPYDTLKRMEKEVKL